MSLTHERLSEEMRQRGIKLGKRWVQIAKDADITTSALGAIRRGEYRPSPHTAAALDEALGWEVGSVEAILDGGEPTVREQRVVLGTATADLGGLQATAVGASEQDEDPKIRRAMELLAEATAMLEEIRQERKRGA